LPHPHDKHNITYKTEKEAPGPGKKGVFFTCMNECVLRWTHFLFLSPKPTFQLTLTLISTCGSQLSSRKAQGIHRARLLALFSNCRCRIKEKRETCFLVSWWRFHNLTIGNACLWSSGVLLLLSGHAESWLGVGDETLAQPPSWRERKRKRAPANCQQQRQQQVQLQTLQRNGSMI